MRYLAGISQAFLFLQMAQLAMDRDQHLWTDPVIQLHQLTPGRMARHMDETVLFGQHIDAKTRQLVLNLAYGQFVPRNLALRKDDGISRFQRHVGM